MLVLVMAVLKACVVYDFNYDGGDEGNNDGEAAGRLG